MPIRGKDAERTCGRAREGRTPEELAEAFLEALFWREHWRSWKKAAPRDKPGEDAKRRRFAAAMARAELGRFYWDRRLEAELQKAGRNGKKGRHG